MCSKSDLSVSTEMYFVPTNDLKDQIYILLTAEVLIMSWNSPVNRKSVIGRYPYNGHNKPIFDIDFQEYTCVWTQQFLELNIL